MHTFVEWLLMDRMEFVGLCLFVFLYRWSDRDSSFSCVASSFVSRLPLWDISSTRLSYLTQSSSISLTWLCCILWLPLASSLTSLLRSVDTTVRQVGGDIISSASWIFQPQSHELTWELVKKMVVGPTQTRQKCSSSHSEHKYHAGFVVLGLL